MLTALMLLTVAQTGPTLPPLATPEIHRVNLVVQRLLSESRFDDAARALEAWPTVVRYSLESPLPERLAGADEVAAELWKQTSGGKITFVRSDERPHVVISLIDSAPGGDPLPEWRSGRWVARIPTRYGNSAELPRRSAEALIAKAFGVSFGLSPTTHRMRVMGLQVHPSNSIEGISLGLDSLEQGTLNSLLTARKELAEAVRNRKTLTPAEPALKIEEDSKDGGTVGRGERAPFTFVLKNEGNAPLIYTAEADCYCVVMSGLEPIAPGETFELEAHINTADFEGQLNKVITLNTNDPAAPRRTLKLNVVSMPEYRILPENPEPIILREDEETVFDLTVYAAPGSRVTVSRVDLSKESVQYNVSEWKGEVLDPMFGPRPIERDGYRVRLTFPKDFPAGLDWVRAVVVTDSRTKPFQTVTLQVHKGIVAQPKSIWFGVVAQGQSERREVTIEHAAEKFNITRIEVESGPFTVSHRPLDDSGRRYVITVEATAGERRTFQSKLIVSTDSRLYPKIEIPLSLVVQ